MNKAAAPSARPAMVCNLRFISILLPGKSGGLHLHRMQVAEADRDPVPGVDDADQGGEVGGLGLVEVLAELLVDVIRRMGFADQGERLGPSEGGALALGVERRFP